MARHDNILSVLWAQARRVAFAILAGIVRGKSADQIGKRISARPAHEQTAIVLAVLAGLLLTSLLFAHAGVIGLLVFFLLVILLIH
ncbi:MAG: hypothetical protein JXJ18_11240 [Rhodobacteraceae bacterium]|nr:hypothetical protein [Paracoccaceae bacterium]